VIDARRLIDVCDAQVMHALQDHLQQIGSDHAKVMSERVTSDLLQQLEHSVKGTPGVSIP
jgi:hypothetical protein